MSQLMKRNMLPIALFCAVFILYLGGLKYYTRPASNNTVEQWVNLTNQMFYGDQDFMFAYGPMFWLTSSGFPSSSSAYSPFAYIASMVYSSSIYALFWALLLSLIIKYRSFILFPIFCALFIRTMRFVGPFYLLPIIIVYYLEYAKASRIKLTYALTIAIGLYVGLSFYVRFYYGVMGAITLGSYFVSVILFDRKNRTLCYFVPSIIVGYLITGLSVFHHKYNILTYLIINTQINMSNSIDLTLDVTNRNITFVLVALALVILNVHLFRTNRLLLLTVNGLYIVFHKMGFHWADGSHFVLYFILPVVIMGLVMLFKEGIFNKALFVAFIATICWMANDPARGGALSYTPFTFGFGVDYEVPYADRMAKTYSMYKLKDSMVSRIGQATVDVYVFHNEYMFANKLNYHYRPSFQNFMTLTPTLDQMNKEFFESDDKPQFVLWTENFCGMTGKYPLSEDPLTSSSILLNYHVVDKAPGKYGAVLLLERNQRTTVYSATHVKKQKMEFNKWYDVPPGDNGVLKLVPNLKLTAFAKFKNALFRGDILYMNYKLASGEIKRHRQSIINSQNGIWVSPFLLSFKYIDRVVAVKLETDAKNYFKPQMTADWITVPIDIQTISSVTSVEPKERISDLNINTDPNYGPILCSLDRYGIDISGNLQLYGWIFLPGIQPEQTTTYLVLTDKNDDQYGYILDKHSRPDVTECFKTGTNLDMSGFSDTIRADQLPEGPFKVSLYVMNNADGYGAVKEFADR